MWSFDFQQKHQNNPVGKGKCFQQMLLENWTSIPGEKTGKPLPVISCGYSCWVVSDSSATLWTGACQAPLSLGFPRQGCWGGLPFPTPGDLPDLGIEPTSLASPALAGNSLPLSHPGSSPYLPGRLPHSIHKNYSRRTLNLNVKSKTIKLLEENREIFSSLEYRQKFLRTEKAITIKERLIDRSKFKTFAHQNSSLRKWMDEPQTEWKVFSKYVSDRGGILDIQRTLKTQ